MGKNYNLITMFGLGKKKTIEYDKLNPNYEILTYADKKGWKVATKTKGMIARKLDSDCVVNSIEGPLNAQAGQIVCRGLDSDDWWVQKEENVNKKYTVQGPLNSEVNFNGQEYSDFVIYNPKPDRTVLVCQIDDTFKVVASWGNLEGKKGDYLIKPSEDAENSNPQDVWLVDKKLFEATYDIK